MNTLKDTKKEAEQKIDDNFDTLKTELSQEQKKAIDTYKEVLNYLGIDVLHNPQNAVVPPDKIITDAIYLTLTADQLMYYVGVLSGIRPYLGEELINAKAKAVYASVWKKYNEVGFRATYRRNALQAEIDRLSEEVNKNVAPKTIEKAVKKHFTEDSLKDESQWRNYIWANLEGEKIRKAELLNFFTGSLDNLIVALKERIRYMNPEKYQAKYGDQMNMPNI